MFYSNAHVVGLEKRGIENENYSMADRDLYNLIHTYLGRGTAFMEIIWF
jgi:hypothetical protein